MAARIHVRLTPRGGRDAIERWQGSVLLVRVASPPIDGAANDALIRLLAKSLRIAPSRISIISGALGRSKILEIEGMDGEAVRTLLGRSEDD